MNPNTQCLYSSFIFFWKWNKQKTVRDAENKYARKQAKVKDTGSRKSGALMIALMYQSKECQMRVTSRRAEYRSVGKIMNGKQVVNGIEKQENCISQADNRLNVRTALPPNESKLTTLITTTKTKTSQTYKHCAKSVMQEKHTFTEKQPTHLMGYAITGDLK